MDKGQFSIEFALILGVLLIALASVTFPLFQSSQEDINRMRRLSQGREAATKLANALNMVYSGGVGSKQTVEYSLPDNVNEIVIDENTSGTDNRIDVQIRFEREGEEELVKVNTLLLGENHENWKGYPLVEENLYENSGKHTASVEYKSKDDNLWIEVEEVSK